MADFYDGPIEDTGWIGFDKFRAPGNRDLSERLIKEVMQTVDVSYAEEWKFDHGIAVPLHFLTPNFDVPIIPANINCQGPPLAPLPRAWAFGEALRRAADSFPERIAIVGTGGISHGRQHQTAARSTSHGIATFSTVGAAMTRMPCSTTTMRASTPTLARAASRSARSSR